MPNIADQSVASYSIGTIPKDGRTWLRVIHATCDTVVYEVCLDDGYLMAQLSLLLEHDCPRRTKGDDWELGHDTTAAYTRRALDMAGITPARARKMAIADLARVPGIGPLERERLEQHKLFGSLRVAADG